MYAWGTPVSKCFWIPTWIFFPHQISRYLWMYLAVAWSIQHNHFLVKVEMFSAFLCQLAPLSLQSFRKHFNNIQNTFTVKPHMKMAIKMQFWVLERNWEVLCDEFLHPHPPCQSFMQIYFLNHSVYQCTTNGKLCNGKTAQW